MAQFCTECGAKLEAEEQFCTQCGAKVEINNIEAVPAENSSFKQPSTVTSPEELVSSSGESIKNHATTPIITSKKIPRSGGWLIAAGYFSPILMILMRNPLFFIAMIILGFYLCLHKSTIANGKQVKTYTIGTRVNGIIFIVIPLLLLILAFIISALNL